MIHSKCGIIGEGHMMAKPMESVVKCPDCKTVTPEADIKEWSGPRRRFPVCPNCGHYKWPAPSITIPNNTKSMPGYGRHATCKRQHCECEPCPEAI